MTGHSKLKIPASLTILPLLGFRARFPSARGDSGPERADKLDGSRFARSKNLAQRLPELTIFPTEDLGEATRASIIELCNAAFHKEDFNQLFSFIPSGGRHFLAYQGTELVSHAVVTTRWLQPDDQPLLKTAYVDAVATRPAYQGQGYGSAVMRHLAANIPDYAIACLETESPGFYERLGWEAWRGPLAGRGGEGLIPTPDQTGVMILRLPRTLPLDLDRGLTIECQAARIW